MARTMFSLAILPYVFIVSFPSTESTESSMSSIRSSAEAPASNACVCQNTTLGLTEGSSDSLEMFYRQGGPCSCVWSLEARCSECYLFVDFSLFHLLPGDSLLITDDMGQLLQMFLPFTPVP